MNILDLLGITEDILDKCSYRTNTGYSLNKDIRKVDKEELFKDVICYVDMLSSLDISSLLGSIDYRIKSADSIKLKLKRHGSSPKRIKSVLNDILGIRGLCVSYTGLFDGLSDRFRVVDMSMGKKNDDGYRGVHVYYQKDSKCYPIEIQFNTYFDRHFNNIMHKYSYKHLDASVGKKLKYLYDSGEIRSEKEFKEVLDNVLYSSKEI